MTELYKRHRPKQLSQVIGQPEAVAVLTKYLKTDTLPHAILFSGPSGTGKTTMARILAERLNPMFVEINCGMVDKPLERVQWIKEQSEYGNDMSGKPWTFVLDEFQAFSRAPHTQDACNKMLEDAEIPYFFLCTTAPNKIIPTVRNRCTIIPTKPVDQGNLRHLVAHIAKEEGHTLDEDVCIKIGSCADGSPRRALVLLDKIMGLKSVKEQLDAIESGSVEVGSIDLCRALLAGKPWKDIADILKKLEGEESEDIRRHVLGYAKSAMYGGKKRAFQIANVFVDHTYDSGFPGLVTMCFRVCN